MQQMREDQKSFQLQLGKSLVAMHKEQQTKLGAIEHHFNKTQDNTLQQDDNTIAATSSETRPMYFTQRPPIPIFRGATNNKHPVKFLEDLELYFRKLEVPPEKRLDIIREALIDEARDWASIFQISWETYEDFRSDFLHAFWSEQAQNKLRHNIATHRWAASQRRTMEAHFAHYVGLARLLTTPMPEHLLIGELMKHFPVNLQSLWALKPESERTITIAAEFLRLQENIMTQATEALVPAPIRQVPPTNKRFRLDNRTQEVSNNRNNNMRNDRRSN